SLAKSLAALLTAGFVTSAGLTSASAAFITIIDTAGGGNFGTDNVLFNDPMTINGTTVMGTFNSNPGYIVNFQSTSGSGQLTGNGGQASISGGTGNNPFTNLKFFLSNGATFTTAILNPDATNAANNQNGGDGTTNGNGTVAFTIDYLTPMGQLLSSPFAINGNGQNYFRIQAGDGARILSVALQVTDTSLQDSGQFRLGGFAPAQRPGRVPDGGTAIALLGVSLLGLGAARKMIGA
ncbi:MAG: hypothetical protein ACRDBP_11890, partial [Luteolibacter sp.]